MIRTIDFRVDVLRNGILYSKLTYEDPPTIYCDTNAEIKMSMQGSFIKNPDVDFLKDELRPVVIIDGVEHPVGVFRPGTYREVFRDGAEFTEVEAYDRAILLKWTRNETVKYFSDSGEYGAAIESILTSSGITSYSIEPMTAHLGTARTFDIGTEFLSIANEFLNEMGYEELWFDQNGMAMVREYVSPTPGSVTKQYGKNTPGGVYTLIAPDVTREIDMFDVPNVFVCVATSPDKVSVVKATAVNDNPTSPLSTINRGRRIAALYTLDQSPNQAALTRYATKLRDKHMWETETVQIQTAINPDHTVGEIVALADDPIAGIYKEKAWSFQMQAGSMMSHTLERMAFA